MEGVQVDVPHLGAALVDDDDFVFHLVKIERLDERIGIETGDTDRPAALARAERNLAGDHLVVPFLHRGLQPVLQNRIGKIGDAIGRLAAIAVRNVGIFLVECDGARSASGGG